MPSPGSGLPPSVLTCAWPPQHGGVSSRAASGEDETNFQRLLRRSPEIGYQRPTRHPLVIPVKTFGFCRSRIMGRRL
eukprot:279176-Pyramimonas_sp.AAC.1